MILSILTGLTFGIGFALGLLIFVFATIVLVKILKGKSKSEFTVEQFEEYKKEILADENYEEAETVNKIIEGLDSNKPPRDLLRKYKLKNEHELIMDSKGDDKTSIKVKNNYKIVLKEDEKK